MLGAKPVCGLFCVIVFMELVNVCEPLQWGDKGVCKDNVIKPRKDVIYNRHGSSNEHAPRTVFKSRKQKPMAESESYVCCTGWTYSRMKKKCLPLCKPACIHGTCEDVNQCTCNDGFKQHPQKPFVCLPRCDPECIHGTCTSPNICKCNEGYTTTANNSTCEPRCDKPCVHGTCTEPNKCKCDSGFKKAATDEFACVPVCDSCVHGTCVSPNNCVCDDGYTWTKEGCKPVCSPICTNGQCSGPNNCTCDSGYQKLPTNPTVCSKPCEEACKNGSCDLNGKCLIIRKSINCNDCDGSCKEGSDDCVCRNGKRCANLMEIPESASELSNEELAGFNLIVILPAVVGLLLTVGIIVVMQRIWQKRNTYSKPPIKPNNGTFGSVVYHTYPSTLMQSMHQRSIDEDDIETANEAATTDNLLNNPQKMEHP